MKGWLEIIKGRIMCRGVKVNSLCGFMYSYVKIMLRYSIKPPAQQVPLGLRSPVPDVIKFSPPASPLPASIAIDLYFLTNIHHLCIMHFAVSLNIIVKVYSACKYLCEPPVV